jgi:hypothetical protein
MLGLEINGGCPLINAAGFAGMGSFWVCGCGLALRCRRTKPSCMRGQDQDDDDDDDVVVNLSDSA